MKFPKRLYLPLSLVVGWTMFAAGPGLFAQEQTQEEKDKKARVRTEEIVVTAPAPQDRPLASTSVIPPTILIPLAPRNLSDILSYAPGAYATSGGKGESRVKIRGLDPDKTTLLIDGVPVYDPYFNTYDLRTVLTEDIESVKVVKGASSVLYGPNTLGGIVDVLTLKPRTPSLTLRAATGRDSNYIVSASGAAAWRKTIFMGAFARDHSDGLRVRTGDSAVLLKNSDYGKTALTGKIYFYPWEKSEILAQASYYSSAYGVADATQYYRSRYWRFKDWRRLTLGLGGTFPLFAKGTLKVRTYYVKLDNTLDQYKNASMDALSWESIYRNYDAGAFILGSHPLGTRNDLRFSLNARLDHVRQQGSATAPWETYEQRTYSAGVEDDFRLSDKWQVTGGFSVDRLKKQTGGSKTSLNPIAGIRFAPTPDLGFHLALSRKSRFPSMRSLYSTSGGNPALRDEIGTTVEAGASWVGPFEGSLAVFSTEVENLIYLRQGAYRIQYLHQHRQGLRQGVRGRSRQVPGRLRRPPVLYLPRHEEQGPEPEAGPRAAVPAQLRRGAGQSRRRTVSPSGGSPYRVRRSSSAAPMSRPTATSSPTPRSRNISGRSRFTSSSTTSSTKSTSPSPATRWHRGASRRASACGSNRRNDELDKRMLR